MNISTGGSYGNPNGAAMGESGAAMGESASSTGGERSVPGIATRLLTIIQMGPPWICPS